MVMARVTKLGLAAALLAVGMTGCGDVEDGDPGSSLRAAGETVEFWNFRPNDPGNGDVDLLDDSDDDGLPDTINWEATTGGSGNTDVFDPTGELVVSTIENQIFDAAGNLRCTAYFEDGLFKLRDGLDGDVLLTATQGRYVFWDNVQALPQPGTYEWYALINHQLGYEFYGDVIYNGPRWSADVIGHANVHVHKANPMRKLLIAALHEGTCGAEQQQQPPPG